MGGTLSLCDVATMQRPHTRSPTGGCWAPRLQLLLLQLQGFKRSFGELRERSVGGKKDAEPKYPECTPLQNSLFPAVRQFRDIAVVCETMNNSHSVMFR